MPLAVLSGQISKLAHPRKMFTTDQSLTAPFIYVFRWQESAERTTPKHLALVERLVEDKNLTDVESSAAGNQKSEVTYDVEPAVLIVWKN